MWSLIRDRWRVVWRVVVYGVLVARSAWIYTPTWWWAIWSVGLSAVVVVGCECLAYDHHCSGEETTARLAARLGEYER